MKKCVFVILIISLLIQCTSCQSTISSSSDTEESSEPTQETEQNNTSNWDFTTDTITIYGLEISQETGLADTKELTKITAEDLVTKIVNLCNDWSFSTEAEEYDEDYYYFIEFNDNTWISMYSDENSGVVADTWTDEGSPVELPSGFNELIISSIN